MLRGIQFIKILAGTAAAFAAGLLVQMLTEFDVFLTLLISAVFFFGIYGIIVILLKEKFVMEILKSVVSLIRSRK